MWDTRYGADGYAYGAEPNDHLVQQVDQIPSGRVLCLAEGEGRNAVFLAKRGYDVTAVDQSAIGLDKAQGLATASGVTISTRQADLANFEIEPGAWQGIVSIWAHVPPAIRVPLHRKVVAGLAPGGVFVLEAYTERQLEMPGRGGPPAAQRELLMSLTSLEQELEGLDFVIGREIDRTVEEGEFHSGPSAVVQILARKQ
ncbi:MAG: class I SAM-dependent methyltransferase [Acidobacteriota bacterium]